MGRSRIRRNTVSKRRRIGKRAIAAGTAAAISLGSGANLRRASAGSGGDPHQLPVKVDVDGDMMSDVEEATLAYLAREPDQNRDRTLDGVELAMLCQVAINELPSEEQAGPGQTFKRQYMAKGLEACDQCSDIVNMGFIEIVNPNQGLTIACPFISLHYMEHGSFSYAGNVHEGRLDVPGLVQALEVRLPGDANDHQLTVPGDSDADMLSSVEESTIGYAPFRPDQNCNAIPDGVELARRCAQVVANLPQHPLVEVPTDAPYKIEHALDGLERCHVCGQWVHMGGWEIHNPKLRLRYPCSSDPLNATFLPDLALHYMEHGAFDCFGDLHGGRTDVDLLLRVLELRTPDDPNEHQLPLTHAMKPEGQLAPDANDYDGDLLSDTEELAAQLNLYNPDQNANLTLDGIELAKQFAATIDALPVYDPYGSDPEPDEPYKVDFFQRGLEFCEVCGVPVNMGWWHLVNPELGLAVDVHDIACHYLSHGSLSYSGLTADPHGEPFHHGRLAVATLAEILEIPNQCGHLGTLYLPGDHNRDCQQDFSDFAEFAEKWLGSTDPGSTHLGQ